MKISKTKNLLLLLLFSFIGIYLIIAFLNTNLLISIITPTILFWIYVLWFCIKYGIPPSLSGSWYVLPNKLKPLFPITVSFISIFLLVTIFKDFHDFYTLLFLSLAIIGLIFVGVFSEFKDKIQKWLHFGGAILSVISVLIWQYIFMNNLIGFISLLVMCISIIFGLKSIFDYNNKKNLIFWLEMIIFFDFYLFIILLKFFLKI